MDGETVDLGSATGILDGQPGARADMMLTHAEGCGSRRPVAAFTELARHGLETGSIELFSATSQLRGGSKSLLP